jgi:crotonobetaine/carnitine-CoA ligase
MPTERFEARIVDGEGRSLEAGKPGELWMRPREPHVMFAGYLGDRGPAEPTREAWTADGWYRSGDLLAWTDDGELRFVGRVRDAIRRRGEMIAPSFVEEAAIGHPAVVEAAAVGVPAEDGVEEEILVCVVAADTPGGSDLDLSDFARFLADALPRYLVPRYVRVVAELPKTPTTRVRKFELREQGTAGAWDTRKQAFV